MMGANLRAAAQGRRAALASAALLLWAAAAGPARAATEVRIAASADTTIFAEQSGSTTYDSISDGSGPSLWTSVIAAGVTRRALVRFNLSAVPADSRVVSVQLQLFEIRARDEHVVRLHRLLAAWGGAMGLQIRQELSSLGPILAFRRPKPDRLLDTAVGHARVGCDAVLQQGETTLRALAREKEQRRYG